MPSKTLKQKTEREKADFVACESRCCTDAEKCQYKFQIPRGKETRAGGPYRVCQERYEQWLRTED